MGETKEEGKKETVSTEDLKKGFLKKKRKSFIKKNKWNPTEFVLKTDSLISYDSNKKETVTLLKDISNVEVAPYKKKGDCLKLETSNGTLTFLSDNKEELESWKESIEKQISIVKTGKPPKKPKKDYLSEFEPLNVFEDSDNLKVMRVKEKKSEKQYTLKGIPKKLLDSEKAGRETEILKSSSHPFIANLHLAFQTDQYVYYVSDPVNKTFGDLMSKEKLEEKEVKFYAAEIVLGLEYLHSNGIMYRALSPNNIYLDDEGHIKLYAFHQSKKAERASTFCGTPEYMAPELKKGEEVEYTKGIDWYAFGVLLYRLLCGEFPFLISLKRLNTSDPKDFEKLQNLKLKEKLQFPKFGISMEAIDFLGMLLAQDPKARLKDVKKVKASPFFKYVDWEKIAKKEEKPPKSVSSLEKKDDLSLQEKEDEEVDDFEDFEWVSESFSN